MSRTISRTIVMCLLLIAVIPVLAQGDRPDPTPAATKNTSIQGDRPEPTPATNKGGTIPNPTGPGGPTSNTGIIRQWAIEAAASTEYSAEGWSANQALGAPDSSGCRDQATAWASLEANDGEYLVVRFEQFVLPTQINVHVVHNTGTIANVLVANSNFTDRFISVPNSAEGRGSPCPNIHSVNVTGIDFAVDSVIIVVNQAASGNWTEIDAVELVGVPVDPSQITPPPATTPVPPQPTTVLGLSVTCPDGIAFNNGVEVVVNMRPGFSYTATAIGIGDFDPIIAVSDENGNILCNDDDANGANYIANLPTTGPIGPSNRTAHKPFTYSGSELGNVSFIVGSFGSTAGEFVLLIEGLAVTRADGSGEGAGDPFLINVTPNMVASGVDYTSYMIAVTNALDTMITAVDANNTIIRLSDGTAVMCDDAGTTNCFGLSEDLTPYYVSRENGRTLGGGRYDSMLHIPNDTFTVEDGGIINYRFTSSGQNTLGDYVAAFHFGTTAGQ
ncbi:MAG: hypothetical protein H3C32_15610 [Anaerolineae bacterium]|nr:MAG: NHL repeat containing protein [Chloroflexi bacterium OLB13]MBW7880723.1 hypothetical protein [Anaerolineae bacterium]